MYLTKAEARKLRDARIILVRLGIRVDSTMFGSDDALLSYRCGLAKHAAETAESAVFDAMSTVRNHLDEPLSEELLHGVYDKARRAESGRDDA